MKHKPWYPVFLDIENAPCLVVGAGIIGERKIASLMACGARVRVVAPEVTSSVDTWANTNQIDLVRAPWTPGMCRGMRLVIAATSVRSVNEEIYTEATSLEIFANTVDVPDLCTFIVPALLRRGDVTVAVSTGGGAPGIAQRIRDRIAGIIAVEYGPFVSALKAVRAELRTLTASSKRHFWRQACALDIDAYRDHPDAFEPLVHQWLNQSSPATPGESCHHTHDPGTGGDA
jgi:precorrin-2 dehydrogenase / sirohydrochlorin ferrochelatase